MLQTIYWILAIIVMAVLLINGIMNLIDMHKSNKRIKELDKKQTEFLDKQLKLLDKSIEEANEKDL